MGEGLVLRFGLGEKVWDYGFFERSILSILIQAMLTASEVVCILGWCLTVV